MHKKSGKLHLVHNLQPLNMVTIHNSGVPPLADYELFFYILGVNPGVSIPASLDRIGPRTKGFNVYHDYYISHHMTHSPVVLPGSMEVQDWWECTSVKVDTLI